MLMQLRLTQLIIWENADRCVTSAMCRCVIMATAALCCDAVWCDMMSSVVLCSATSPFLVAIPELLKAYKIWLFCHILHNTAFRGVGLMNQLWFFVDNCEGMLHPDPSLHCAASWLHLTHEEDSTILSCIENTSAPISASDLRCSQERYRSNSVWFPSYIFGFRSSMRCAMAWTASGL